MTTDSQSTGASASFVCEQCGKTFTLPAATLARYPSWKPRACMQCRDAAGGGAARASKSARKPQAARSASRSTRTGAPFSTAEVLARFDAGPTTGVFTDGSCSGNPGPGGWGAVRVVDGRIVEERYGSDPDTTNNRMELTAMAEGLAMIPAGEQAEVYSDSRLVVQTLTGWAAGWERRGWKHADGEVKNLDLVQRAYALAKARPAARIQWIRAHDGSRWNEYADALSTAYMRATP